MNLDNTPEISLRPASAMPIHERDRTIPTARQVRDQSITVLKYTTVDKLNR